MEVMCGFRGEIPRVPLFHPGEDVEPLHDEDEDGGRGDHHDDDREK